MQRNRKHQKAGNLIPKIARVKRSAPKGLMDYNNILKCIREIYQYPYRYAQNLASKVYRSGADPNSLPSVLKEESRIFRERGDDQIRKVNELISNHEKKVKGATKSSKPIIKETALNKHLKTYIIVGENKMDYKTFLIEKRE